MSVSTVLSYLMGTSPFSVEMRALGMAFQGAMNVRKGPNRDRSLHPFHAYALTTVVAFGGGWFGFMWMGKPTSLISGADITLTACLIAFVIATYTPFDFGFKLGNSLPVVLVTTSVAQLFRAMGMISFISTAAKELNASPYYPIPVLGPILYGCLLGNMGGFFSKGFDGHLKNGIPWPFQNAMLIGTFFHLFAHDTEGPLGTYLRNAVYSIGDGALMGGLDDRTFAIVATSIFMQVTGILMLPQLMGPSWNPIINPWIWLGQTVSKSFSVEPREKKKMPPAAQASGAKTTENVQSKSKRKKKRQ